jgi:hypothetical protein
MPLERGNLLQRIIRRRLPENAWIEVNNLLADADHVRDVRPEQVARIAERYHTPLRGELCGRLERLYRDYLLFCLSDQRLSAEEQTDLAHLKRILRLNDRAVSSIHGQVTERLYARSVDAVLEDGRIDAHEREFLRTLQDELAIPTQVVDRIMESRRRQRRD